MVSNNSIAMSHSKKKLARKKLFGGALVVSFGIVSYIFIGYVTVANLAVFIESSSHDTTSSSCAQQVSTD